MGRILVGTSSWTDPGLVRSGFYPPQAKDAEERLKYYSTNFSLVEVDATYHVLPSLRNSRLWVERTPSSFKFDAKAFSLFTQFPTPLASLPTDIRAESKGKEGNVYLHHLTNPAVDELWRRFRVGLSPLQEAGKLGAVVFQFPPWFHPKPENFDYMARCRSRLAEFRVGIEFRTASWFSSDNKTSTLEFLRTHDLSLVCVDEPQGLKSSVPRMAEVTSSVAIIRFHGRNTDTWEARGVLPEERFNYLYSRDELVWWVPRVRRLARQADEVHLIFKNKHLDNTPRNAHEMMALLGLSAP